MTFPTQNWKRSPVSIPSRVCWKIACSKRMLLYIIIKKILCCTDCTLILCIVLHIVVTLSIEVIIGAGVTVMFGGGLSTTKAVRIRRYSSGICPSLVETENSLVDILRPDFICLYKFFTVALLFLPFTVYNYITTVYIPCGYLMVMCKLCYGWI